MRKLLSIVLSLLMSLGIMAQSNQERVFIQCGKGYLTLRVLSDNAVRIKYYNTEAEVGKSQLPEWVYINEGEGKTKLTTTEKADIATLATESMKVTVDKKSGVLTISNAEGVEVFKATSHELEASKVQELSTYISSLTIATPQDEYLYGLGQFQDGHTNLRGQTRRLTQVNTQISMPFMLSSKGYALLWNNYGLVDFNPTDNSVSLVRSEEEGEQTMVDVTSTEGGKKEKRVSNVFSATFDIKEEGDYALLLDVGQSMARRHNISIDGNEILDVRNVWLPPTTSVVRHFKAGKHIITAELERNDKPTIHYKKVTDETVFRSPVSECVDYTIFIGSADETISTYRQLTGASPMLPQWAFGYIHCRERYKSQDELLSNARTFRERGLPIDVIVQDWLYWGKYGWNAMKFDEEHYPAPDKMVEELHSMNMHLMLSVWSKVDPSSELGKQMSSRGYYIPGTSWIDFFNTDASKYYWENFSSRLLKPYKIDAWWQDATEPENDDLVGRRVMNGTVPGEVYRNVYPLLVSKTVFEGLRRDDAERRAMILTRSGFPGIQRYGSVLWTGDVGNDWETLERQIASGLGMMSSGHPWWTYDAGGFFRPYDQHKNEAYIECMLRWIEASVFFPLMRVHGYQSDTEPWRYGEDAENIIADNLKLRYKLLPYIYSEAAKVCFEGSTLMRPLVFDFASDSKALESKHSYMFGPSLLVSPITKPGVNSWTTYLPLVPGGWYDLYSGKHINGGVEQTQQVTLANIPVYVKAGSILPFGPERQYASENAGGQIELRIYPGADGQFTLYEDEGDNYNYEKGASSSIDMTWNDKSHTLVIAKRKGEFSGMVSKRKFVVTLPNGTSRDIDYDGKKVELTIR